MLEINKIICHDVAKPFPLPDECIDVCITSPPYWGLRDYGEDVYTIWNGHSDCKHDWGQTLPKGGRTKRREDGDPKHKKEGIAKGFALASGGNFCQICGAWKGQLGLEPHPQMYIDHLVEIFREVKRVLKKSGSFYLNLGDTYFGGKGKSANKWSENHFNRETIQSKKYNINKDKPQDVCLQNNNWLQPKQLMLIPIRVAIALQEDGWILRNDIIWRKPNPMLSSVKDRLNNTYEHVFHFVKNNNPVFYYNIKMGKSADKKPSGLKEGIDWGWKDCQHCEGTGWILEDSEALTKEDDEYIEQEEGEKCNKCKGKGKIKISYWKSLVYYYDLDAIRVPHKESSIIRDIKGYKQSPMKGRYTVDWEKRNGTSDQEFCHPSGKNPGDILDATTKGFKGAHFAVFPLDLIDKPLRATIPRQICKKCGKSRVRILRKKERVQQHWAPGTDKKTEQSKGKHGTTSTLVTGYKFNYETIGWTDCGCNAGFGEGIALDLFAGRGTVGKWCKENWGRYILFDIKPEYCEMANLYIYSQQRKVHKNDSKLTDFL